MTKIETVLYTGKTHTTGGRDGSAQSDDGALGIKLSPPGSGKPGTNPEQLFAAGWSACFIGAMTKAAAKRQLRLPADTAVDAEVDLGTTGGEFFLQARLSVSLPGIDRPVAQAIIEDAHQICPIRRQPGGTSMLRSSSLKPIVSARAFVVAIVFAAIFAAPCVYDATSDEPSPLAGLLGAVSSM